MVFQQAYDIVIPRLRQELSSNLFYHGVHHTLDVINAVQTLATEESLNALDTECLLIAALFHDTGYLFQYEDNEIHGVNYAKEVLKKLNYPVDQRLLVENIILSTTIGIKPTNLLEELMSDADFDYFGRDDFFEIAENLRLELNIYGGAISAHTWDKLQIEFIEQHHYYTKSAQKKRLPKKLDNLNSIKKRLISY